jgi:hypothetical protein
MTHYRGLDSGAVKVPAHPTHSHQPPTPSSHITCHSSQPKHKAGKRGRANGATLHAAALVPSFSVPSWLNELSWLPGGAWRRRHRRGRAPGGGRAFRGGSGAPGGHGPRAPGALHPWRRRGRCKSTARHTTGERCLAARQTTRGGSDHMNAGQDGSASEAVTEGCH